MKSPGARIRTSLSRHIRTPAASQKELLTMRERAWQEQGIAVIRLSDLGDDWDRLHLNSIASKLYGPRKKQEQR